MSFMIVETPDDKPEDTQKFRNCGPGVYRPSSGYDGIRYVALPEGLKVLVCESRQTIMQATLCLDVDCIPTGEVMRISFEEPGQ